MPPAPPPPPPPPPRPAGKLTASRIGDGSDEDKKAAAEILASPTKFSVSSYLNVALRTESSSAREEGKTDADADATLQARMAELALLLQVQTQSCHDEIGRIGAELNAILPRCKADVERLEKGLEGMADDASGLLGSVASGPPGSVQGGGRSGKGGSNSIVGRGIHVQAAGLGRGHAMRPGQSGSGSTGNRPAPATDTLSTLHSLRTNLRRTRHVLSAAASWDATLSSIPGLLSSQNLSEAVLALSSLERGEKALSGMPGRTERKENLIRIRSQIEVLLRPQLLHALGKMDTRLGPLQQCVSMYVQLEKIDSLVDEYVRLRPAEIHKGWFAFVAPTPAMQQLQPAAAAMGAGDESQPDEDFNDDDLGFGNEADAPAAAGAAASTTSSEAFATAFLAWLPGWFSSVEALISEELRRATAVFGQNVAPDIVIKVLRECFRPILPSFKTRLASLCPADVNEGKHGMSGSWSLSAVCSAYEATIHFLSQSYEQLISSIESPTISAASASSGDKESSVFLRPSTTVTGNPRDAYGLIKSVFAYIASPFSPYQQHLAKIEKNHCGAASGVMARDIQAAVAGRNVGSDLSNLQSAVDRLQELSSAIFPLATGAISRFELLNGGFNADETVGTIDIILAKHAGELAIAVSTLRTSMTADEDMLADRFDEEHAQCSLEILKVAGKMKRALLRSEESTRAIFRGILERLEAFGDRYTYMSEQDPISPNDAPFDLPESLEAIDVAHIVSYAACGKVHGDHGSSGKEGSLASLSIFAGHQGSSEASTLFPNTIEAIARLSKTCHVFIFDVCSAVPRRALRDLPSLPIWRKDANSQDNLSYGILPQQYINSVGEHMLALVQAIEPFASDPDALEVADNVMDGSREVALPLWRDLASAIGGTDANRDDVVAALMNIQSLQEYVGPADNVVDTEEIDGDEDEAISATALFTNKWLDAIGLAVTGYLLERTLRVHHLSQVGCEHMSVDFSYLINVFEALGIAGHPHPLLVHVCKLLSMPAEEMVGGMSSDTRTPLGRAIRACEMRLSLMRGLET